MTTLMIVLAVLVLAEVIVYRYGRDTRDGDNWVLHRGAEFEAHAR